MKNKLVERIIYLLKNDPLGWKYDEFHFRYGKFSMWIANRLYADISVGFYRIGNFFDRIKIRKLINLVVENQLLARLDEGADNENKM